MFSQPIHHTIFYALLYACPNMLREQGSLELQVTNCLGVSKSLTNQYQVTPFPAG